MFVMVASVRAKERGTGARWASTASDRLGAMFTSRWANQTLDVLSGTEAGVVEAPGLDGGDDDGGGGDGGGDGDELKKVSQNAGSCSETDSL